jgi:hypothetical protein
MNLLKVKLAISHALAQSTKLGIYEERIQSVVEDTRHLPETLAENGSVHIGRHEIAQLIGQVRLAERALVRASKISTNPLHLAVPCGCSPIVWYAESYLFRSVFGFKREEADAKSIALGLE